MSNIFVIFHVLTQVFNILQDGALVSAHGGVRQGPSGTVHQGGVGNMNCKYICLLIVFR
jgi:hypothetical protein